MTMLDALEDLLRPAIDAALPGGLTVVAGPWDPSGNGVVVHATALEVQPPADDPPGDEEAHLLSLVDFDADGVALDFEIPEAQTGELIEVEAPPGYTAARGDAYFLDDRTIRFYQAPAAANPGVRARLRGDAAAGWKRRRPCALTLEISAWNNDSDDADAHLAVALQVALAELVELPNLETAAAPGVSVQLRVRKPRVWLDSVERQHIASANLFEFKATLTLRGELDVLVAKGEPPSVGVIESIEGQVSVNHADGEPLEPEAFVISGEDPPLVVGPRPIESDDPALLLTVSTSVLSDLDGFTPPVTTIAALAELDIPSIVDELVNVTEVKIGELRQRAKLVLAFPHLPELPASALVPSLTTLINQDVETLAVMLDHGPAYAASLHAELLTLQILLKGSAMSSLTLADFSAT
ncbi:hypothetical protein PPSIR1_14775 [Plesiocystis pacifica SIR-1]|uniref:Uncharacterized protein n=1 Tax=Plesiocystis pacifica SIR-1 TaxID=391625 RepID=A6GIT5_9BACT|nr:hypothetical protein [Plesiocystis pacifica]EDM74230.1 hypothetical protein PPSIR1_14775 [Plesiocystis pacifica SIR-1]